MPSTPFRIATRGSALALAQAHQVLALCRTAFPQRTFELRILKTTGDRRQAVSMARPNAKLPKGLFTKELEVALLRGDADLAVHSLKDLPTELPDGLRLAAVLPREDPRDVLVLRARDVPRRRSDRATSTDALSYLRPGATVATSSTRRAAQLLRARPDLRLVEIRGNVPTRLQKLAAAQDFDATILAAAGLARLGIVADPRGLLTCPPTLADAAWSLPVRGFPISLDQMLPAPGQAAIGLECRQGDRVAGAVCRRLNHAETLTCVRAERAFLSGFGGGCQSPLAALATLHRRHVNLSVIAFDGDRSWSAQVAGPSVSAVALGRKAGRAARKAVLPPAAP